MLDFRFPRRSDFCDGIRRRDFLRVGGLTMGGLTLTDFLRLRLRAGAAGEPSAKTGKPWGKAGILIWLGGGPSHIETFDPKPEAMSEIRGPFGTIPTKLPGLYVGELFPRLARIADKFSVVRSCCHTQSGHGGGQRWVMTGYPSRSPEFELPHDYPNVGSVVAHMCGPNRHGMPAFAAVPPSNLHNNSAAYLGAGANPIELYTNGRSPGMRLDSIVPATRLADRRELRQSLDRLRHEVDATGLMDGLDELEQQAFDLVTGDAAQTAFDVNQEPDAMRDAYGRNLIGESCLFARRLIEAGTTFVTVSSGGWDQHGQAGGTILDKYRERGPQVDQGVAALLEDLDARGLLDETVVYLLGEFGRTPRINSTGGRDHWPQAMSVLMTGGGLARGQIVGATSSKGEHPIERPLGPADILATIYHTLNVDYRREFLNGDGRPVTLLPEGEPIRELI